MSMLSPTSLLLARLLRLARAGKHPGRLSVVCAAGLVLAGLLLYPDRFLGGSVETNKPAANQPDRSPVDLVLTPDEQWLVTANQTSDTVSLVQVATGKVGAEASCGKRPTAVALTPDARKVLVSGTFGGDLTVFDLKEGTLSKAWRIHLGFEPRGLAVSPDGRHAYVALTTAHAVAVVDLERREVIERISVGRWPRQLALSPDGRRLAVGANGDGGVSVVDTKARKMLYHEDFAGLNLGQMQVSADGKQVYFPYMIYRQNPLSPTMIARGWILASRIARVRLDGKARREAMSLDPRDKAVSDPHGLAISPDEQRLVATAAGTHELLVYRLRDLPLSQNYGPATDHIDKALLNDPDRFCRIELGGRPMAVRFSRDGRRVYTANYLLNAVQVVSLDDRKVEKTIPLGSPQQPSLSRRGEAIFYDGQRSYQQWYSCNSCHYEGHTNAATMETPTDLAPMSYMVVPSLRNVTRTGPWTWHGVHKELEVSLRNQMTGTMGKGAKDQPTDDDVKAVIAFLETLSPPPNPYRRPAGGLTEAAQRGEKVFRSKKAGCATCHSGAYFSDGRIHDVGTGFPRTGKSKHDDVPVGGAYKDKTSYNRVGDAYRGFNTPSLIGVYDRLMYLHDGQAQSLKEVLTGPHSPAKAHGGDNLTGKELSDLIDYLKAL